MKATTGVGRYWKYKYNLFRKYNARFCACGEIGATVAIFQTEGATIKEIYCSECIGKEKRLKTPEINVNNFDQYFRAGNACKVIAHSGDVCFWWRLLEAVFHNTSTNFC
jgi:hypothetical protein